MMANLHFITHAVLLSILAVIVKKYMDLKSRVEDLEMDCYPHPLLSEPEQEVFKFKKDLNFVATSASKIEVSENYAGIDNLGATKYGQDTAAGHYQFSETDFIQSSQSEQSSQADYIYKSSDDAQSGSYFEEYKKTTSELSYSNVIHSSSGSTDKTTDSEKSEFQYIENPASSQGNVESIISNDSSEEIKSEEAEDEHKDSSQFETSVWCHGDSIKSRLCHFENLCYSPMDESFIFFHTNRSILDKSQIGNESRSLLYLSSVIDYTGHSLDLIDLPPSGVDQSAVRWFRTQSLILSRFKPDNILHVLHDDIFPLHFSLNFMTRQHSAAEKYDVQLVFMEGWDPGNYEDLYSIFTSYPLIYKANLSSVHMTCFKYASVGLSVETLWYQYGYVKPQSPLENIGASGFHIRNTVNYIVNLLDMKEEPSMILSSSDYIILLSRKENRRITNEMELMLSLSSEIGMKVFILSLETHSIKEIMHYIRFSRGIVGMHGSLMALAAFLRPGSFVAELFPYAVNADKYTPFKTLAELPGMTLFYTSWQNQHKSKSNAHPNWPADLGGIVHLSSEEQAAIISQNEVPDHLCCADPSWLYHIYQDTTVDIPAITKLIKAALEKSSQTHSLHLFPSKVREIGCEQVKGDNLNKTPSSKNKEKGSYDFKIKWSSPRNLNYLGFGLLHYEVRVVQQGAEDILYLVKDSSLVVALTNTGLDAKVWVRAVTDNMMGGQYNYTECSFR